MVEGAMCKIIQNVEQIVEGRFHFKAIYERIEEPNLPIFQSTKGSIFINKKIEKFKSNTKQELVCDGTPQEVENNIIKALKYQRIGYWTAKFVYDYRLYFDRSFIGLGVILYKHSYVPSICLIP